MLGFVKIRLGFLRPPSLLYPLPDPPPKGLHGEESVHSAGGVSLPLLSLLDISRLWGGRLHYALPLAIV
jgi:hypothetical protein